MEQPVESLSHLLVREVFAAIQGLLAKLNRFNESGFFREIPADSLLRQRIRVTASMGGKFRKLVLLFRREVYFHIRQSRGVIPARQRVAARGVRAWPGSMRAQTLLWLLLRSRKTDLPVVADEPRDYYAGELAAEKGNWRRRRLNTFQSFDHTALRSHFGLDRDFGGGELRKMERRDCFSLLTRADEKILFPQVAANRFLACVNTYR